MAKSKLGKFEDAYSKLALFFDEQGSNMTAEQFEEYYEQFIAAQLKPLEHAEGDRKNTTFRIGLGMKSRWKAIENKPTTRSEYKEGYRGILKSKSGPHTSTITKQVIGANDACRTYTHSITTESADPANPIPELGYTTTFMPGIGAWITRGGQSIKAAPDYCTTKERIQETPDEKPQRVDKPKKETIKKVIIGGVVFLLLGTIVVLSYIGSKLGWFQPSETPPGPGYTDSATMTGDDKTKDHYTYIDGETSDDSETEEETEEDAFKGHNDRLLDEDKDKNPTKNDTYKDAHQETNGALVDGSSAENPAETPAETPAKGDKPVVGEATDKGFITGSDGAAKEIVDDKEEETAQKPLGLG